jgi:hypothetical protein
VVAAGHPQGLTPHLRRPGTADAPASAGGGEQRDGATTIKPVRHRIRRLP